MPLPLGKLPPEVLEKHILSTIRTWSKDVVLGPRPGVDFAVCKIGDGRYLVASSDPVTGAPENVGWHAVHVSANDVATSGTRPRFLEIVILLPEGSGSRLLDRIVRQINSAAEGLKISVLGGHTELTPGIDYPIVITTAFGFCERFVTAAGARPGDRVMMTKTAGIEGTGILAGLMKDRLRPLGGYLLKTGRGMIRRMSVVDEACAAFETGYVHAMHDPTEGGILGGVYEMAEASGLGFIVSESKIPIARETEAICNLLKVDPLRLIASGALLMAVDPEGVEEVRKAVGRTGARTSEIGAFGEGERILAKKSGRRVRMKEGVIDELWRFFSAEGE